MRCFEDSKLERRFAAQKANETSQRPQLEVLAVYEKSTVFYFYNLHTKWDLIFTSLGHFVHKKPSIFDVWL